MALNCNFATFTPYTLENFLSDGGFDRRSDRLSLKLEASPQVFGQLPSHTTFFFEEFCGHGATERVDELRLFG